MFKINQSLNFPELFNWGLKFTLNSYIEKIENELHKYDYSIEMISIDFVNYEYNTTDQINYSKIIPQPTVFHIECH